MYETEPSFRLRPASAADQWTIWRMVLGAGLNPLHLSWKNFILAVGPEEDVRGCGQVKPHKNGVRELASVYVVPEARGKGLARALIEKLLSNHPGTVWLTCRRELVEFYKRFGFEDVRAVDAMPAYFRRVKKLVDLFSPGSDRSRLAVMRLVGR